MARIYFVLIVMGLSVLSGCGQQRNAERPKASELQERLEQQVAQTAHLQVELEKSQAELKTSETRNIELEKVLKASSELVQTQAAELLNAREQIAELTGQVGRMSSAIDEISAILRKLPVFFESDTNQESHDESHNKSHDDHSHDEHGH